MYKYEYVLVKEKKGNLRGTQEHRDIIEKYAQDGYRYVGFIPTLTKGMGLHMGSAAIDLVFEKKEQ